jgi:hypothetical protein
LINTCLPHAPLAGHWSSLALATNTRANCFREVAFGHPSANSSRGSDAMGIDLKKVNAEIKDLKSMLAAIDHHVEECRLRYFEDPWATQIRRTLTFERHRVQRRLEELTFVCRCIGERALGPASALSFRSLAGSGRRNGEGVEVIGRAISDLKRDRPMLRIIQGGHS